MISSVDSGILLDPSTLKKACLAVYKSLNDSNDKVRTHDPARVFYVLSHNRL